MCMPPRITKDSASSNNDQADQVDRTQISRTLSGADIENGIDHINEIYNKDQLIYAPKFARPTAEQIIRAICSRIHFILCVEDSDKKGDQVDTEKPDQFLIKQKIVVGNWTIDLNKEEYRLHFGKYKTVQENLEARLQRPVQVKFENGIFTVSV